MIFMLVLNIKRIDVYMFEFYNVLFFRSYDHKYKRLNFCGLEFSEKLDVEWRKEMDTFGGPNMYGIQTVH